MTRLRFDEKYVFVELEKVGNALSSPVTLYLIGGAAMIRYGLKAATKDIDSSEGNIRRCSQRRYSKMKMGSDGISSRNMYAENSDCQQA